MTVWSENKVSYKGLLDYLEFISRTYQLNICINDFAGFLSIFDEELDSFQPYLIHNNGFCMQIKSDRQLWNKCLAMKKKIIRKCEKKRDIFLGMCYCGVEEYVMPVFCDQQLIGTIFAGQFSTHPGASQFRIGKVAKTAGMGGELLKEKFGHTIQKELPEAALVKSLLGVVVDYLSNAYRMACTGGKLDPACFSHSGEEYIYLHALEFIKQNYRSDIGLTDICRYCNCSSSYLSRIFNRRKKTTIHAHINRLRVEEARRLLMVSGYTISEIALSIGYNDPDYFSVTFRKLTGESPTDYRKRIQT